MFAVAEVEIVVHTTKENSSVREYKPLNEILSEAESGLADRERGEIQ